MKGQKVLSYTIIATLLLALAIPVLSMGIAPASAAPTLTISPSEGTPRVRSAAIAANAAAATLITVTGSGLPGGQDNIKIRILASSSTAGAGLGTQLTTTAGSGDLHDSSLFGTDSNTVKADANGWFKAKIRVPDGYAAGTYNIYAEYTPSGGASTITSTATLTINAAVYAWSRLDKTQVGTYLTPVEILVAGFKAGESITVAPTDFLTSSVYGSTALSFTLTSGKTGTYTAITSNGNTGYIDDRPGGSFTVTVTGGSSGTSATSTFTVNPSIAVLTSHSTSSYQPGTAATTRLSIHASSSVMWLTGHNFGASKTLESASSATLTSGSTVTTLTHSAIKSGAKGGFGHKKLTYTTGLTLGEVTIDINDTDFNLAGNNVIPPGMGGAVTNHLGAQINYGDKGGGIDATVSTKNGKPIGGIIIASQLSGPPIMTLDASSYTVGGVVTIIGAGLSGQSTVTHTYTPTGGSASTPTTGPTAITTDSLGAYLAQMVGASQTVGTATLYGLPASRQSSNTLAASASVGTSPDTITIAVDPKVNTLTTHLSYKENPAIILTGYKAQALSVTIGDTTWGEISSSDVSAIGTVSLTAGNFAALPNVGSGSLSVTAAGTTAANTASKTVTVYPEADPADSSTSVLSVTSVQDGDSVSLLTASASGLHGLSASTAYTVYLGATSDAAELTTFTSTADGTVPAGVTFTVPASVVGTHLIDIRDADGDSKIWGAIEESAQSQFTNLELTVTGKITPSPTVGNNSDTVTISGTGLKKETSYVLTLGVTADTPVAISYKDFTSSTTGAIPTSTSFDFPEKPTDGANGEQGTTYYVYAQTSSQFGTTGASSYDASGRFILQSSVSMGASSGTAGTAVSITLNAGQANAVYNVIWNYVAGTTTTTFTGQTVTSLSTNALGTATGTFNVPSAAASGSTYPINLVVVSGSDTTANTKILVTDSEFSVVAAVAAPTVSTSISPAAPSTGSAITVTSTVTAASGATISSVTLSYKGVDDTAFTSVAMTADGSSYTGTIPAQSSTGTVEYYVAAEDSSSNTTYDPATAPTTGTSVTVSTPAPITGTSTSTLSDAATQTTAGVSQTSFAAGSTVAFSVSLTNNAAEAKNFLIVSQVKDSAGAVVAITYSSLNNVAAGASGSYSLSPVITGSGLIASAGTYSFEIFVFDDLASQTALSTPTSSVNFSLT